MANIFINALKAKTGGGKNILDNFIVNLHKLDSTHTWYILTPNKQGYSKYESSNIVIVDIHNLFKKNILFPLLYYIVLQRLIAKLKIDLIFNFGDVIIPGSHNQIYFFDWAYAIYPEKYIWNNMSIKDYFIRKTKVFLIKKSLKDVKVTIAQTKNTASRLKKYYGLDDVVEIPTPVGFEFNQADKNMCFNLPISTKKFLFPASFSSHKNFDVIVPLGKLIKEKKLPYTIVLTIDLNSKTKEFFNEIKKNSLDCIVSVGKLDNKLMPSLYSQCNALLLPTLLESFGLPYVESMAYGLPIITSDLDFAHSICGDLAFYFDPFDVNSVLAAMEDSNKNEDETKRRITAGKEKVSLLPGWQQVFIKFREQIEKVLN